MESLSKRDKEKMAHEKMIVTAAERVFCRKGYEDAGMDEIAKEAQFTKRTVYQHFDNKDELYFAVVLKGLKKLFSKMTEAGNLEQFGYDRLESSFKCYDRFCRDNPDFVRLTNCLSIVQSRAAEEGRFKKELIQFNHVMLRSFADMVEEGKADGSIVAGLDAEKTGLCLLFLITGFYRQLSSTGETFTEFFQDHEELCLHAIDLIVKPLKRNRTVMAARKGTA